MDEKFEEILKSDGGPFIRKLLEYEKKRVDKFNIEIKKREPNIFEQMNIDFGIFPEEVCYPVYFHGDLMKPKNKIVIIGINPGKESTNEEKCEYCEYLNEEKGLFEQYCNIFINCFKDKGFFMEGEGGSFNFIPRYAIQIAAVVFYFTKFAIFLFGPALVCRQLQTQRLCYGRRRLMLEQV